MLLCTFFVRSLMPPQQKPLVSQSTVVGFIVLMFAIVYMKSLAPEDKDNLGQFATSFGKLMKTKVGSYFD